MSKTHFKERDKGWNGPYTLENFAPTDTDWIADRNREPVEDIDILNLLNSQHRSGIGEEEIEYCAKLEHDRWARWQKHVHSCCIRRDNEDLVIPVNYIEQWERQIATPYSELSESEKEADRKEVREYAHLLRSQPTISDTPSPEVIDSVVIIPVVEALRKIHLNTSFVETKWKRSC